MFKKSKRCKPRANDTTNRCQALFLWTIARGLKNGTPHARRLRIADPTPNTRLARGVWNVMSIALRLVQSLAFCLAVATVVDAAQPPATLPPVARPPVASQPPASLTPIENVQPIRAKQVLGSKVFLAGDVHAGIVDDMVFDEGGNIEYVIVNKDNKLVTVPWSAVKFNFEKQTATLAVTQQQYQVIPTYTIQTYPSFYDPTYRTKVYSWYGLTPGQLRRIERRQ
jgi:hypothetical protein